MTIERERFDDLGEPDERGLLDYAYRGWNLTYRDEHGEIKGRVYDEKPDVLSVFPLERDGPPYAERFARAVLLLMDSVGASSVKCLGCGGARGYVPIDVLELRAAARGIPRR